MYTIQTPMCVLTAGRYEDPQSETKVDRGKPISANVLTFFVLLLTFAALPELTVGQPFSLEPPEDPLYQNVNDLNHLVYDVQGTKTSQWNAVGGGVNNYAFSVATYGDHVFVGGLFDKATQTNGTVMTVGFIAHWDGVAWHNMDGGLNGPALTMVVIGSELYVGGSFTKAGLSGPGGAVTTHNIAKWDLVGGGWSALGSGIIGVGKEVNVFAVSGNDLYVGGTFTVAGGVPGTEYLARWDLIANTWNAVGPNVTCGTDCTYPIIALAVDGTDLYVGGQLSDAGVPDTQNLAKLDLATGTWSDVGGGVDGVVQHLVAGGSTVTICGGFENAGTTTVNGFASYSPSSGWQSIGGGVDGMATMFLGGYVGGGFDAAGPAPTPVNNIALWNGSGWDDMAGGTTASGGAFAPYVWDMASTSNGLYIVGGFTEAGGVISPHVARWGANLDDDDDGITSPVENNAPNGGDGNADGILDSQQENVASLPNASDGQYVTLEVSEGVTLVDVIAVDPPAPEELPPGASFPVGAFDFSVTGVSPGSAVDVTLLLPAGTMADAYYQYGATSDNTTPHWYLFDYDGTTGAEIFADRVLIHFVDGQRGDSDLVADGIITDPGTLVKFTSGVAVESGPEVPVHNTLYQNYPNPFNPTTKISYALCEQSKVRLSIYDLLGREIGELVNHTIPPGVHHVVFEASGLPSGLYMYRLEAGTYLDMKFMTLMK